MPRDLKEAFKLKLEERARELGLSDFYDKIADETTANTPEELLEFLKVKSHPVLSMPPLL